MQHSKAPHTNIISFESARAAMLAKKLGSDGRQVPTGKASREDIVRRFRQQRQEAERYENKWEGDVPDVPA
jgi:hypothetical protein